MGHYVTLPNNETMEVSGAFIKIILRWLKEVAGSERCIDPLIGGGNYEWLSSLKALPLCDLDLEGLGSFSKHLEDLLEKLPEIAQEWNRPEFQTYFRKCATELLIKIKKFQKDLRT